MRCLALADELRRSGAVCRFFSKRAAGDLNDFIRSEWEFEVTEMALESHADIDAAMREDADALRLACGASVGFDWLVVDHYSLDARWESACRSVSQRILVIDDLANRPHDCDILLDQNLYADPTRRYLTLVPEFSRALLGPSFALLRREFVDARAKMRVRDGIVRRILVFFGGSDPTDETTKAIEGICSMEREEMTVDVVVGKSNPNGRRVEELCDRNASLRFHCQVKNLAELMAAADVSFGAAGTSTWERCCVGLPSMVTILAENQAEVAAVAGSAGLVVNLGRAERLRASDYGLALDGLTARALTDMQSRCVSTVDANGASRVAAALLNW